MLAAIGAGSIEELYASIPERLRVAGALDIEPRVGSEEELRRRLEGLLDRNVSRPRPRLLPRRRLLAALRAGGGRRDPRPRRVPDRVLRRDVLRPRQAAGAVRVREHGRRPGRVRRRLPADLRLGLGGGERDPDGRPSHRPPPRAGAGADLARAPLDHQRHGRHAGRCRGRCRATRPPAPLDLAALDRAARRRRRVRLLRDARLPRHARAGRGRHHRAGARRRGAGRRRRRRHLARRARGAAAVRRRPRLRRAPGLRHPHALRRRHDRLHRQRGRRAARRRVPDVPDRRRAHGGGRVGLRRGALGPDGLRAARRGDATSPAPRRACGRSAWPSTWRCSGRTGCASSVPRSCSAAGTRRSGWARSRACGRPR